MSTTELTTPPPPPSGGHQRSATLNARPPASRFPTLEQRLDEVLPLVFVVPVAGPPAILLLGPLLLIDLLLIPPAALVITLVAVTVVAAALLAALVGLIASPYLLVRHLRNHRTRKSEQRPRGHGLREVRPIGVTLLPQRSDAGLLRGAAVQPPLAAQLHNDAAHAFLEWCKPLGRRGPPEAGPGGSPAASCSRPNMRR